jgi:hypothetical protein
VREHRHSFGRELHSEEVLSLELLINLYYRLDSALGLTL